MLLAKELRAAVLQSAIKGELTSQSNSDTAVSDTISECLKNKGIWIEEKRTRKEKKIEPINEAEIPFSIPISWKWVRLSDICNVTDGTHQTPTYVERGVPFISAQNVKPFAFDEKVYAYVSEEDHIEYNKTVSPEKGDVLMTRVGAGIGEAAVITTDYDFSIYVSVALIKPYIPNFDMRYLVCVLNSPFGRDYAERKTLGKKASQGNYNLGFIRDMIIPLPPIEEQKRICERVYVLISKLDEYEELETELSRIEEAFPQDLRNSVLAEAFQGLLTEQLESDTPVSQFIEELKGIRKHKITELSEGDFSVPDTWKYLNLIDVADIYTGNSIPEAVKKEKYTDIPEGYPYIATKDVLFTKVVQYDNGVKIPYEEEGFKYAYKDATLLCIEGGSAGRKIAIIDRQVCFGNKLCAFNPVLVNKEYLYYFLQSPLFTNVFMDKKTGLIGGVSINKIRKLGIPIPPIEEQERVVERIKQLLPYCK